MEYVLNIAVTERDVDKNGFCTNKFFLKCLEDVATAHSESVSYGLVDLRKNGVTWMLVDWRVKILRRPRLSENIEFHTWSRGTQKIFAIRDYAAYIGGELVALASSRWIIFDYIHGAIAKINDDTLVKYCHEKEKHAFPDGSFEKLSKADDYDGEFFYAVKDDDIDLNGHVHNLSYLDIASKALGENELFDEFSISFKKEIMPENKVVCKYKKGADEALFMICCEDTGSINALIKMHSLQRIQ